MKGMEVDVTKLQLNLTCVDNEWLSSIQVDCMTRCDPKCQNGGVCIQGNNCKCKDEYFGRHCEFKKCPGTPFSLSVEIFAVR